MFNGRMGRGIIIGTVWMISINKQPAPIVVFYSLIWITIFLLLLVADRSTDPKLRWLVWCVELLILLYTINSITGAIP